MYAVFAWFVYSKRYGIPIKKT